MAQIEIVLKRSKQGEWTLGVQAGGICHTPSLDKASLEELQRVLGHCQKIIDPDSIPDTKLAPSSTTKIEKFVDGDKSIKTTKDVPEFSEFRRLPKREIVSPVKEPVLKPSTSPDFSEEPLIETSVFVKSDDEILEAADKARQKIAKDFNSADQHASSKLPKTEIPVSKSELKPKPESTFKFDPKSQSKPKPTPKTGGNVSSLDMLNSAVAARNGKTPPPTSRDNRKPLKYDHTIREGWIDNAHGLEFTALTHPLPRNQDKLIKVLRDYAVPDMGFGVVKMSDNILAKKSGLGSSSVRGTLIALEGKSLIECDGGSGCKIFVY